MEILANGYGQLRTFDIHRPVDTIGQALPWFTYPAIEYLKRFNFKGWRVFEYGAGQSTVYWSRRGAIVTSVEHNPQWFAEVKEALPGAAISHRSDKEAYVNAVGDEGVRFNVIVIDGVWREACADACIPHLSDDGILILDNSDWYHQAGTRIRSKGFLEVSFSGFGPVNNYTWTTSLFFRLPNSSYRLTPPAPIGGNILGPDAVNEWW
ncbi:hypothetical protein QA641_16635 [Bradyrhizobium sp. CB1650]|uniref:hypothetical protein n=1 Tax=Bradyrhizobium sp. CB1650 TaxID=3039153 RepID=UPI002435B041|nr:hypothetical protein [Bradyrhizobium sp. CB1650]WGD55354.1 hypothetical protein QA641_16635 [Bradyrhizobium sp. CB1650]